MGKRGPRLVSVGDVADFLAKLVREVYCDKIEVKKATTMGYLCSQLRGCLEVVDLETRIAALEAQLTQQRSGPSSRVALSNRSVKE